MKKFGLTYEAIEKKFGCPPIQAVQADLDRHVIWVYYETKDEHHESHEVQFGPTPIFLAADV